MYPQIFTKSVIKINFLSYICTTNESVSSFAIAHWWPHHRPAADSTVRPNARSQYLSTRTAFSLIGNLSMSEHGEHYSAWPKVTFDVMMSGEGGHTRRIFGVRISCPAGLSPSKRWRRRGRERCSDVGEAANAPRWWMSCIIACMLADAGPLA
jgi:hypothetical protein